MNKTRFLILKHDENDWDIICENGQFAYSYPDEGLGYIKIQRYTDRIEKPFFTYDGMLEQIAYDGGAYVEDHEEITQMNVELFEQIAKELSSSETATIFEVSTQIIPRDGTSTWEAISRAMINEFLFGNTQKIQCPKCAKEQVYGLVKGKDSEVKMCTECRAIL